MDRLQLTAVYCNRRRVYRQHVKLPVFAMQKCATIRLQMKLTIIQSDYKCTVGLQNPEGKNSTLGIAYAWWNRATRRTTPMTTWPPRPRAPSTQRIWTSTRPVVRFWSSWSAHHIAWLKFESCTSFMSSMHAVSVTLRLWALHSIQLPLLLILFQSLAVPPALLPQPWGQ